MHPSLLASARSEDPTPPDRSLLTSQEAKVLDLLADGLSSREIGAMLGLAPTTVRNYVSNILTKWGLHSRTQAALLAARVRAEPTIADLGRGRRS